MARRSWLIPSMILVGAVIGVRASIHPPSASNPLFRDVTEALGLPQVRATQVLVPDLNGDGYPDLVFVQGNKDGTSVQAYLNSSGQALEPVEVRGLSLEGRYHLRLVSGLFRDGETGALFHSINDNGAKIESLRYFQVRLNGQDLLFDELKDQDLPRHRGPLTMVQLFDWNRDGLLDLVAGMYYLPGRGYEAERLRLFTGVKKGRSRGFRDSTRGSGLDLDSDGPESRVAPAPVYAMSVCDIDGDGWMDLLAPSYGRRWNKLFLNQRGRGFRLSSFPLGFHGDPVGQTHFRGNGNSFASVCGDADNDGKIDVFQGEITHAWAGPTSDVSAILWNRFPEPFHRDPGLPRPTNFDNQGDLSAVWGDVDLDGWQDLLISNSDYPPETRLLLWRQTAPRRFMDISQELGEPLINPKGAVLVDLDLDGDLDIVSASSPMRGNDLPYARIWLNQRSERGDARWLQVTLIGDGKRVPELPIGSRVTVALPDGTRLTRELSLGFSSDHQLPESLHFGLGGTVRPGDSVSLEVRWSDGSRSKHRLPVNQRHRLVR